MEEWLRIGGYIGSMLTSMIAAGASAVYWVDKRSKRRRLEDYLKARKERFPHEAFSATRLMADLGMTEAEIFAASFASRHIARGVRRDKATGFAAEVLSSIERNPRTRVKGSPAVLISLWTRADFAFPTKARTASASDFARWCGIAGPTRYSTGVHFVATTLPKLSPRVCPAPVTIASLQSKRLRSPNQLARTRAGLF